MMQATYTQDLVSEAACTLAARIRRGARSGRQFSLALSGGTTPWAILSHLAQCTGIRWDLVHVYQVDERVAPMGHPDRNLIHLDEAFLSHVPAVSHPMPVDEPDLAAAAAGYGRHLPHALDLVHLGLGGDGHTASLLPRDRAIVLTDIDPLSLNPQHLGATTHVEEPPVR